MAFSDTVNRVIALADAVRDYWETELPKRHPKYPIVEEDADDGPPPPEEAELNSLLRSLPAVQLYRLMALANLGRGMIPTADFSREVQEISAEGLPPDAVARQLAAKGALGAYLADGLRSLTAGGVDIDRLEAAAA